MESFIEESLKSKPDFYMWLGDNAAHEPWNLDEVEHMWATKEITKLFGKRPEYMHVGKMYPIIGNHEGMPCDQFDVIGNTDQWILDQLTDIWKPWFTKECKYEL